MEWYILPSNVSFRGVKIKEGVAVGKAEDWLKDVGMDGVIHPAGTPHEVLRTVSDKGGQVAGLDQVALESFKVGTTSVRNGAIVPPLAKGTFEWLIPWYYIAFGNNEVFFKNVPHKATTAANGTITISKGDSQTASVKYSDNDSSPNDYNNLKDDYWNP